MEHLKLFQLLIRHFHDIFWLSRMNIFVKMYVRTEDILPKSGEEVDIFIPFLSEGKWTCDFGLPYTTETHRFSAALNIFDGLSGPSKI
jgi:hypothetical protein